MNYTIATHFPDALLLKKGGPALSLYMPTHRHITKGKHDPLTFKNLVKEATTLLQSNYSSKDLAPLLSLFKKIEQDNLFWSKSLDGLAFFANVDEMIIYRIEKEVTPYVVVSETFHVKPLIEYFQSIESFECLVIDGQSFALYEGNHLHLSQIQLPPETKTTLKEVLGDQYTESYQTHGAYGGASDGSIFHGHGGKSDEVAIDLIKFFRHVDEFVLEKISKYSKKPLILVSLKEYHAIFHKLSNNPFLLKENIEGSIQNNKTDDTKQALKRIVNQRFLNRVNQYMNQYQNLKSKDLCSDQPTSIYKALLSARVEVLFIESQKIIPGKIIEKTQKLHLGKLDDPKLNDVLDDFINYALKMGTQIFILPNTIMPTISGIAASFRY